MTSIFHRPTRALLLLSLMALIPGCKHAAKFPAQLSDLKAPIAMLKKEIDLVFVQENQRLPAHILYKRQDRYAFVRGQTDAPFKLEMIINPLMRNPTVTARVEKGGKTVREFVAKKTATSILSEKKTSWTPARSKLALIIPYVAQNEVVVVTTTYEWMDIRWHPPIFLQEDAMPTMESKVTVDVPYGITMHFKAAKDRARLEYLPASFPRELPLWIQDDNRAGLGMRYVWNADVESMSSQQNPANLLQLLLSFESPSQNDASQRFDSWSKVSSYIYHRIDRYDMPSNEIRAYAVKETRDIMNEEEKIKHLLLFLQNNIEKRSAVGSFQEQELQPATRTFARRFGTPSDVAILGKSPLSSIGVEADLVAAGDRRINPELSDFYSPALFSSIILAYTTNGVTRYFDPEAIKAMPDQLKPHRQGQQALVLRAKNGINFSLPYDNAQKNLRTYSYQLWLSEEGVLEGEYSIDLMGFEAESAKQEGSEKLRSKSIAELETHLYGTQRTDFSLESVEYLYDTSDQGLRVSGLIKPRLLFKNGHGGYDLKLEKIIEPALLALKDAHAKGFSSTTKISLFVGLPDNFIVGNLPSSQTISFGGVEGRFFAEASAGQLIVEGIAMVSLPLKGNAHEKLAPALESIVAFGNQNLAIHHESFVDVVGNAPQQQSLENTLRDANNGDGLQEEDTQNSGEEVPHAEGIETQNEAPPHGEGAQNAREESPHEENSSLAAYVSIAAAIAFLIADQHPPTLAIGTKAPIEEKILRFDGSTTTFRKMLTKPMVVNFWATWCPPCLKELPTLSKLSHKFRDKIIFVGAALNSDIEDIAAYKKQYVLNYELLAINDALADIWQARALPTTYVLDTTGTITWAQTGVITDEELERAILLSIKK